jgi:hypothetical protein
MIAEEPEAQAHGIRTLRSEKGFVFEKWHVMAQLLRSQRVEMALKMVMQYPEPTIGRRRAGAIGIRTRWDPEKSFASFGLSR